MGGWDSLEPGLYGPGVAYSRSVRISVALCTWNGEAYLSEQLGSLERQERLPDEVVVSDDRSSDGTVDLLQAFVERAPFPVVLAAPSERLGATRNFDRAIRRCSGDVIVLCDQDDVWAPEKLGRIEMLMGRRPEVGFMFGDAQLIDGQGRSMDWRLWDAIRFTPEQRWRAQRGEIGLLLLRRRIVTGATMAFRSYLVDAVSPIPEVWPHDAWTALIAGCMSPCALLPGALVHYRIHPGQHLGIRSQWSAESPWRDAVLDRGEHHRLAAERFRCALDRLTAKDNDGAKGTGTRMDAVLTNLEELIRHRQTRAALPRSRFRRASIVFDEWRSGRYRRFGRGSLSALRDLS